MRSVSRAIRRQVSRTSVTAASGCRQGFASECLRGAIVAENDGLRFHVTSARPRDCLRHPMMIGRQIAYRIGIRGITRQHVRLAAATPEVVRFFRTRATRFLHPCIVAIAVEALRVVPNCFQARVADVGECEPGELDPRTADRKRADRPLPARQPRAGVEQARKSHGS